MTNLLDFINAKNELSKRREQMNESFKNNDWNGALEKITNLLSKKIKNLVYAKTWEVKQGSKTLLAHQYLVDVKNKSNRMMFTINTNVGSNTNVYSIDFYNNIDLYTKGKANTATTIYTLGTSVAYFLPIIIDICNTRNFKLSQSDFSGNKEMKESRDYYIGAQKWTIYENMAEQVADDVFRIVTESDDEDISQELKDYKDAKKKERDEAYAEYKQNGRKDKSRYAAVYQEYEDIVKAIQGGAKTIEDVKCSIKNNVSTIAVVSPQLVQAEAEATKQSKDPKQAFAAMERYIKGTIQGVKNGCVIAGAPGIGKTHRVLKALEAEGYRDIDDNQEYNNRTSGGKYFMKISGKLTAPILYTSLYIMRNSSDILVVDDADSIINPKADDAINIFKAALDNGKRRVSYQVATKLRDDRVNGDIPKSFVYGGKVIILTNNNMGQIDTAIRTRAFLQMLDFNTEQLLELIKEIMPNIAPDILTPKSKQAALKYLQELAKNGTEMKISIRTFENCAKIYMIKELDPSMSEDEVKYMIEEQMENQTVEGGKHF